LTRGHQIWGIVGHSGDVKHADLAKAGAATANSVSKSCGWQRHAALLIAVASDTYDVLPDAERLALPDEQRIIIPIDSSGATGE
jgi:hypothetical protein